MTDKRTEMKVVIGTRGSELALWQAYFVESELKKIGVKVEIKIIKTQGDIITHLSFDKMEGKGFFTKEIEAALLSKSIDLAVHSHKDLETTSPKGLIIAAVSEREDPSDMLLINKKSFDGSLDLSVKKNAVIGTSSARRQTQLLSFRPDIELKDLRGNVQTRMQKLRDGNYDAIMLATAGMERLKVDLSEFEIKKFNPNEFVPAPAQGVLGLQIREEDKELFDLLQKHLHYKEVEDCITEERKVLKALDGGCQLPLGSYCEKTSNGFQLKISLGQKEGGVIRLSAEGDSTKGLADKVLSDLKKKRLV